jgi:hypothetical protein
MRLGLYFQGCYGNPHLDRCHPVDSLVRSVGIHQWLGSCWTPCSLEFRLADPKANRLFVLGYPRKNPPHGQRRRNMDRRGARATLAVAILLVLCVGDTRSDPTATSDVQVRSIPQCLCPFLRASSLSPALVLRCFAAACGLRLAARGARRSE